MEPIKGNIVGIKDEYTVVINKGSEDGVKEGDVFVIYDEGEEIIDITGESLGTLEIVKGKVEVDHTAERYSICSSRKEIEVRVPSSLINTMNFFYESNSLYETKKVEIAPLKVNKEEINSELNLEPTEIKIGDLVKQELD
ncbi:hypothetical protein [Methanobacterium sp. ACI-7]|uniref:hypothetical protein n=1 Tax=unclassified Methanobacterium TaxID=2627676 RepID=UPI0039C1F974